MFESIEPLISAVEDEKDEGALDIGVRIIGAGLVAVWGKSGSMGSGGGIHASLETHVNIHVK